MTERFDLSDPAQHAAGMVAASEAIRKGELIVLPTDTVYGVGADAFTPWAVSRLLAAKGRGRDMPPPVLVGTVRAASALVDDFGPFGQDLIDEFWPGGLTLVARATPTLAWDLGDTKGTVAVRMPLHAAALDLLKATGPMAVSSANTTGRQAATTVDEAMEQLGDSISVYLDGGQCGGGVASTIIDLTGSVPRLLRAGAISMDRLREVAALITGDEVSEPEVNGTPVLPEPDDPEPATEAVADMTGDAADEVVPDGPPDIPSDSPADARADALAAAAAETPSEDPAEQLMTDAGQAQLAADDPAAPVTTEDADAAPHPAGPKKPARARKPAAPRKPAAARTTTPRKPAANRTTRAKAADTSAAETPAEAAPAADTQAPAAPAKATTTRKPAPRKPAGQATTRRTAARKATSSAPAAAAEDTGDTGPASAPGEAQPGDES
jgi:tRNA threonylcarbamoyl adenosine modification protein (Sua5/YciO/YrdC/YwlC family)